MEPGEHEPSMLRGLQLSGTVREALDSATERCEPGRPLQTGMVLAALIEADAHGDWGRVWPSYDGTAEALLTSDDDTNALASGERWRQTDLSEDLLAALDVLAETARRYGMDPVQPGALALALTSISEGSASHQMSQLSGYSTAELIDLIQSDLLGTSLEGFGAAKQPGAEQPVSRPTALLSTAGLAAAAACAFGGWQALRLITGPLGGGVLAFIVLLALLPTMRKNKGIRTAAVEPTEIAHWSLANYLHPLKLIGLLVPASFLIWVLLNRHRLRPVYPLGVTFGVLGLAIVVFVAGNSSAGQRVGRNSRTRRYTWFPADTHYHRLPITCAVVTGVVVTLLAGVVQFVSQHGSLAPGGPPFARWIEGMLFDSAFGGWLPLWYYSGLVIMAATAGGYLMGAAVWAASKARLATTAPSWRWHAVAACLIGATVIVLGNLPQSPLTYPALKGTLYTVPRRFPTYPDTITFGNGFSFSGLRWTYASPSKAVATGYVQVNDCSPSCATGTLHSIPVDVEFIEPRRCPIESIYVHVTVDIFTEIKITPIFGSLPWYLPGSYWIIATCM